MLRNPALIYTDVTWKTSGSLRRLFGKPKGRSDLPMSPHCNGQGLLKLLPYAFWAYAELF